MTGIMSIRTSAARRELVSNTQTKYGAGVFDGLSATLAAKCPFDFLWLSGFSVSASAGLPDAGLIEAGDMLERLRAIRRVSTLPVVVDLDSGYGDPLRIYHVVREFAEAGAKALCIEDNPTSKRCSLYESGPRALVSTAEHVARLQAAIAAVRSVDADCLVIARTEALVAKRGVAEALERASAYSAAGADAIFVQSTDTTGSDALEFARRWRRRLPLFMAPTKFATIPRATLHATGVTHVICANHAVRAAHRAMLETFRTLADSDSIGATDHQITSVAQLSVDVGEDRLNAIDRTFVVPFVPFECAKGS